jgi:hypothetical protein
MPTASPSIRARIGVVDCRSTNPVSAVIPAAPMPTPTAAVSRFIPAATSDPYVTASTTSAATTPIPSAAPPGSDGGWLA